MGPERRGFETYLQRRRYVYVYVWEPVQSVLARREQAEN